MWMNFKSICDKCGINFFLSVELSSKICMILHHINWFNKGVVDTLTFATTETGWDPPHSCWGRWFCSCRSLSGEAECTVSTRINILNCEGLNWILRPLGFRTFDILGFFVYKNNEIGAICRINTSKSLEISPITATINLLATINNCQESYMYLWEWYDITGLFLLI